MATPTFSSFPTKGSIFKFFIVWHTVVRIITIIRMGDWPSQLGLTTKMSRFNKQHSYKTSDFSLPKTSRCCSTPLEQASPGTKGNPSQPLRSKHNSFPTILCLLHQIAQRVEINVLNSALSTNRSTNKHRLNRLAKQEPMIIRFQLFIRTTQQALRHTTPLPPSARSQ